MTYKSARWANSEHIGVLLSNDDQPDLYVDGGPLYESALAGKYGDIGDPIVIASPPPTIEEISAPIRARRDDLLAASDWAMTPDAPTDKPAWIAYRAALRDIPQQPGFPYDVAWPEKPE
jgi:hypothetical protein